jgi:hypothetical protein
MFTRFFQYIAVKVLVWWTIRELRRSFVRVTALPPDEAREVITRWRWQVTHELALDDEVREEYLLALARLEQIVAAGEQEDDMEEAA